MIPTFENYKNEIVESINELSEKLDVFDDENISIIRFDNEDEAPEESIDEESIAIDEYIAGLATNEQIAETNQLLSAIVEQQETIIEQQTQLNNSINEGSWIISITIIVALGFKYFLEQFSKW